MNKFFLRNQNVRTKLLLQSFNVWTKSYFETKTLKVLLRIIWNIASTQNKTISCNWKCSNKKSYFRNQNIVTKSCFEALSCTKSSFETKISKCLNKSLASNPKILNEKSCFETKMFASLSSKPKSLRKSLATKPQRFNKNLVSKLKRLDKFHTSKR